MNSGPLPVVMRASREIHYKKTQCPSVCLKCGADRYDNPLPHVLVGPDHGIDIKASHAKIKRFH